MDENTIRRVQPHNEKAEQGIVGTMLVNQVASSDLVDMLTGEDFYNKQSGILFDNVSFVFVDMYGSAHRYRFILILHPAWNVFAGREMKLLYSGFSGNAGDVLFIYATSGE